MSAAGLTVEISSRLRDFELDLEIAAAPGECVALVGPSGAGKSTLLRTIAGLHRADAGRVVMDGRTWVDTGQGVDLAPEQRACAYMFQDYALFPQMSAWKNVAFGLRRLPPRDRRARALALLEAFGVPEVADAPPRQLSGGERQRVALARALATEPDVLLLDEPLSALDARTAAASARVLSQAISGSEAPTVLVTHDFAEAALFAGRVAVVDRGRVVQVGTPAELSARPVSAFVAGFAGATVLFGEARSEGDGNTVIELDGGGSIVTVERGSGPVAVAVYPWEITLEPPGARAEGSALNRLEVNISSITEVAGRARVGLLGPQPLVAEITDESVRRLDLQPGSRAVAVWKATATRLIER